MSDVVLQDRYEIVGRLGAGGQGTVFEAIDRRLGIHVAVKKSIETRDEWREAFVREARLLAGLRHQNLPVVSDHFVEANSQYLVLELVPGDDLEERVNRQRSVCSVDEVFAWTDQLLDALEYLHSQSPPIIHRDIKPRNLKVRPDGRLILLDFGLAKGRPAQDPELDMSLSMPGYSYGFAPLEQIVPQGTDARSDLYAVGATMYFLLAGRAPPDATVRNRDRTRQADSIRPLESINLGIPGPLAGLVHRALELHPDQRFQSATEMRRSLTRARRSLGNWTPRVTGDSQPIVDPPDTPTRVPRRRVRATTVSPHESNVSDARPGADSTPAPAQPREVQAGEVAPGLTPVEPPTPVDDPPMPPWAKPDPGQQIDRRLHRLGEGFGLALAHGGQSSDRWALASDRPNAVGRSAPSTNPPDIDLWPDRHTSREHARVWHADHFWWVEDAGSTHGSRVDGRSLTPRQAVVLRPWSELQIGETTLFLAPPGWRRVRARDLVLDLELVGAVSSSLLHAGLPIVRRMVARNHGKTTRPAGAVQIALQPCFGPVSIAVPALEPGTSAPLRLPPIVPSYDVLEGQIERSRRRLAVSIDGHRQRGEPIDCWLLPHNEWSTLPEHRLALAAFVLPNHPAVAALAAEVTAVVKPDAPAVELLAALFDVLSERWHVTYRLEPPHWAADSQKVRLPHQVLHDDAGRRGEGTCLDLVLLTAACMENLGLQPVVAVVDAGRWWHALVGCWNPPEAALETLRFDVDAVVHRAIWFDPTCATRDERLRRPFAEARTVATDSLTERGLIFALDVTAARGEGITPLPFAGLPSWSPGVGRAIEAAHAHARKSEGQLCSAALLAGLLTDGDGLTSNLVGSVLGDAAAAARSIVSALPPSPPAPPASTGYRQILDVARSRAKAAGSPTVLEVHLLGALLAMRSASLDRALGKLGSDQQRLTQALRALNNAPDFLHSTSSDVR